MKTILEIIKKNKIIKQFTFLSLLLLMTSWAYSADDLSKEFKKFKRTTQNIENKLGKLPAATTKEALIIDSAINELKEAITFAEESYSSEDIETATMTLDFIDKSVGDIMKLAPRETFSDMSEVDMTSMDPETLTEMQKITSEMKANKEKKMKDFVQNMNLVNQKGLNLFQISYQLGDLGVQTLNLQEIAQIINDDPKLKAAVLKSIKQGLKESGLSTKEINNQIKLPEVTLASLPKTTTEESPEVIAARKAVEDAETAKKSANDAKTTADEAKKIAEEASAKAQRLSDEAKELAGKKDSILDEALKAAKKAQEEAQEAKNLANQAAQDYQDALDIAKEAQKLADAASGSEWDISGSLKARYENKLSNTAIDSVKTKSKIDFETESALAAREATDDYREKAKAIAAAAKTKELVRSAAIARGLSDSEADILANNASTKFLDIHFVAVQTVDDLMAQGLSEEEAQKEMEKFVMNKYGVWADRLWGDSDDEGIAANTEAVNTWITGVKTLQDAATNFKTGDPNDEKEIAGYAKEAADLVRSRALAGGLSESEADALAANAEKVVKNGLYHVFMSYEAFIEQGYSEEEAERLADKVALERYGDWERLLYGANNDGALPDEATIDTFIIHVKALGIVSGSGANTEYLNKAKAAATETQNLFYTEALKQGMSNEDAEKFAKESAQAVYGIVALGYTAWDLTGVDEGCDEACYAIRDKILDKIMDDEYLDWFEKLYNPNHDFDTSLIPSADRITVYVAGVLTTDASAELQEAANEAFAAADKAKETKDDYENKKGIADDLLAKANSFADQSSAEAQAAHAKARTALAEAEKALEIAQRAANLSEEAKKALAEAQAYYNQKLKELDDLLASLPPSDVPKKGVFYPKGPPTRNENWKGKPDLEGMERLAAQEAAKPIRKMAKGTISGNPRLAAAMNGMTDGAVYKLLESGVLSTDMVNEYIANGKNPPIEPSEFKEAVRDMAYGTITSNERLSAAMNGMTDTDVYKLLESGILDTDMVKEYINDGKNAPVLPCGSSSCEMVPGTYYNGTFYDPNNEFGEAKSLEEMGIIPPTTTDDASATSEIASATSEIAKEVAEEVQLNAAAIAGQAKAAAAEAAAAVAASENAAAKADPDSEHYIPPNQGEKTPDK